MATVKPYDEYLQHGLTRPIRLPAPLVTYWILTICAAAFAVVGIAGMCIAERPVEFLIGLLITAFFGGGAAVVFPPFLKPGHIVAFDDEGFETRRYKVKIRWADVTAVGIVTTQGAESLCVAVEDYERYRAQVPWNAAWLRAIYRSLPGRVGAVALVAALDLRESVEAWKSVSNVKDFDFIWSASEFPNMDVSHVRDLVEDQSRIARGLQVLETGAA